MGGSENNSNFWSAVLQCEDLCHCCWSELLPWPVQVLGLGIAGLGNEVIDNETE